MAATAGRRVRKTARRRRPGPAGRRRRRPGAAGRRRRRPGVAGGRRRCGVAGGRQRGGGGEKRRIWGFFPPRPPSVLICPAASTTPGGAAASPGDARTPASTDPAPPRRPWPRRSAPSSVRRQRSPIETNPSHAHCLLPSPCPPRISSATLASCGVYTML